MSSDNASSMVTYASISSDSNGLLWGIPLVNAGELSEMDPYEEVEDQPYADDASPTAESPGYIVDPDSIEEDTDEDSIDYPDEPEDGKEDDDEDPEEDPNPPPLLYLSMSMCRSQDDGSKPSSDDGKKVDEDSRKDSEVNVVGGKTSIKLSLDPNMPKLEDYIIFEDDEDVGVEADMHNLYRTIQEEPKKIEEEVYVCQPPGFEDPDFPDRVYKVEKALYGLHQALRACTRNKQWLQIPQQKLNMWLLQVVVDKCLDSESTT
ncbi:ribonuclease H-like domain-containing protein [Tanacetum coccineum]